MKYDVVVEVLVGIGKEDAALMMAAVADVMHEKIQRDLGYRVFGIQVLQAPQQHRVRPKRVQGDQSGSQVAKQRDGKDYQVNYVRNAK